MKKKGHELETKLNVSNAKSGTLVTTVPKFIADHFDLTRLDIFEWYITDDGSSIHICIAKGARNLDLDDYRPGRQDARNDYRKVFR